MQPVADRERLFPIRFILLNYLKSVKIKSKQDHFFAAGME